nr:cation-transporting P-type ATPase [Candidatus Prometheoarchaeum syntrophicum]QEE15990.1 putative copper-exporting P-type ATPase A [Candidatus Prometheoarchaeum syntrophicum]
MTNTLEPTIPKPENIFYYNYPIEEIFNEFSIDPKRGLSSEQALKSLELNGPNELKKVKKSLIKVILAPIINLLIIIYLLSAVAMWALGEVQRTVPTFIIVGFNAIVAIVQQLRAEKQLEALKKLSEASATVIRDGKETVLPTNEVVVGDIIKVKTGDKIPADCRILECMNLSIDESSLTGESEPVKKTQDLNPNHEEELPLQDQKNMMFFGTFVALGQCSAIVVHTGAHTEIGKISTMLEESSTGEIPLRNKMNHVAKYLGIGVLILLIFSIIWKSFVLSSLESLSWDSFRDAMILSIDLGMKVMPINLPLLTTIVLLTGVLVMAQKGVIVRELSRTESLGRVSVVCSDKTGTLTKNEMTITKIWTASKEYEVSGYGYDPEGIVHYSWNRANPVENFELDMLISSGYLNNNCVLNQKIVGTLGKSKTKTSWSIIGLPTEASLKVLGKKYKSDIDDKIKVYEFIHEFSFDSSIKRMSKLFSKDGNKILFTKGATEWILPLCSRYQLEGKNLPINEEIRTKILENMNLYAGQGYRILTITNRLIDETLIEQDLESETARQTFESDLIFLGFVVILDPPRDDVFQAITDCKKAGINVIMITGDSISTGKAIAEKLDIYNEGINLAIEGNQLEGISEKEFPKISVYGRVSPEHKQIIVQRYQKMGKVVSMSGDGVNDALALSMADCGLAMGIQGTEVAKEAADMVITDDSFSTIVTGIREGRSLFMKIRTIIYFFVCVSVMEAIILFSATLNINDPFFEMWDYGQLNILYVTAHLFPSLGFTFGNISKTIMDEKPRDSAEIITKDIIKIMLVQMLLIGLAIIIVYYLCLNGTIGLSEFNLSGIGYNGSPNEVPQFQIKARTMGFVILFILESILMPLQIRRINHSLKDSLHDINYKKEFLFYIPSFLILIVGIYSLSIQEIIGQNLGTMFNFNFMFLDIRDWVICLIACLPALFGFEYIRKIARKKHISF